MIFNHYHSGIKINNLVTEINLTLKPEQAASKDKFLLIAANILKINVTSINNYRILKKSIDARKKNIVVNMSLQIVFNDKDFKFQKKDFKFNDVKNSKQVIIIGAGPAGLFAALKLIELGLKPIILERGKIIKERRHDIAKLNREHIVNPDSNYAFGEGGAGTFSDGKLYTRSKKRGNVKEILDLLQFHGANENITFESRPHIGTNKLPAIISKIRETITFYGGEILFDKKLTNINISFDKITGVTINKNEILKTNAVILATGHSASDVYELLYNKKIKLFNKPFALGVRVEHQQSLIDSIQYHCSIRNEFLPPANYNLVNQINNRGVFSFCMCPGGFIVPATTSSDKLVINGMSPSNRNSKFANSGIVVEVKDEDLINFKEFGELAGLKFQQHIEQLAFINANKTQSAPAQRLTDFINRKFSNSLPETSYFPGLTSSELYNWLPKSISKRLQVGFKVFDKKMKGFLTEQAIVLGVESRTSSPVRIPRSKETFQHEQVSGLFPCGEGAGYAGGIVSSAVDGQNSAIKVYEFLR